MPRVHCHDLAFAAALLLRRLPPVRRADLTPSARGAVLLLLGVGIPAVLAGCSLPTGPFRPDGIAYVLVEVDGDELPTTYFRNETTQLTVLADTIWLGGHGSGARHAVLRGENGASAEDGDLQDRREEFHYELDGQHLTLAFRCPGFFTFALCAAPPHGEGVLEPDRLRMAFMLGARGPLVYRRVD